MPAQGVRSQAVALAKEPLDASPHTRQIQALPSRGSRVCAVVRTASARSSLGRDALPLSGGARSCLRTRGSIAAT
eukprot:8036804-Lingulodinium_polyedra.AAC.1